MAASPTFVRAQSSGDGGNNQSGNGNEKPKPRPTPTPKPKGTPNPDPNYTRSTSNTSGTADQWSVGTNWDATPTSDATTQLVFGGAVPASLTAGVTVFTNNDIAGDFKLNILNFTYAGPASGAAPTVTISGNRLEFISNGATTPTMSIAASGTVKPLLTISNDLLLTNNLSIAAASDGTLSGTISGGGDLTKSGAGTLTLSGANTYTGATTLNAGTLQLGSSSTGSITNGPVGTGTLILNGGTLSSDSTTARSIANAITFGGDVTLGNGTNFGALTLSGAGTLKGSRTLTLNSDVTYSGNIGESGGARSLTKNGSGTLVLSGSNSYSGGTTANDGLLQLNSTSALGSTSGSLTVNAASGNAAILDLNGNSISVGNLTGTGGNIWNNGPNAGSSTVTLTIGTGDTGGGNYQGVISNNNGAAPSAKVALTKTGTGTITLSGANTYTGATTVNGGTLLVNGSGSIASGSAVSVNNSGTTLGGTGTINGPVSVASSGAKLLGGAGAAASGSLTLANNLTMSAGSIIELALGGSGQHSTLARTGGTWTFDNTQAFTFIDLGATGGGTTYENIITSLASDPLTEVAWTITNAGWTGTFTFDATDNGMDLTLIAVPEPSTWIAGGLAFGALAFGQRKRIRRLLARA